MSRFLYVVRVTSSIQVEVQKKLFWQVYYLLKFLPSSQHPISSCSSLLLLIIGWDTTRFSVLLFFFILSTFVLPMIFYAFLSFVFNIRVVSALFLSDTCHYRMYSCFKLKLDNNICSFVDSFKLICGLQLPREPHRSTGFSDLHMAPRRDDMISIPLCQYINAYFLYHVS